ncbi:YlzJ-like family protein [Moorellaceae bacterium AZ2]
MVIYTPMIPELIWEGADRFCPSFQEIRVGKVTLLVEPVGFHQARVVRLLSTDPADYLHSPYQPGRIVSFVPGSVVDPWQK